MDVEGLGYFSLKAKSPKIAWLFAYLFNCGCLLVFVNVVVAVVVVVVAVVNSLLLLLRTVVVPVKTAC